MEVTAKPAGVEETVDNKQSGYLTGFTGMFKRIIKETATLVTAVEEAEKVQTEPFSHPVYYPDG